MKITKRQLRKIIRETVGNRSPRASLREARRRRPDYAQASWKMDRILPDDDPHLYDMYYDLESEGDHEGLTQFSWEHGDEERLLMYAGPDATFEGFVKYLLSK